MGAGQIKHNFGLAEAVAAALGWRETADERPPPPFTFWVSGATFGAVSNTSHWQLKDQTGPERKGSVDDDKGKPYVQSNE